MGKAISKIVYNFDEYKQNSLKTFEKYEFSRFYDQVISAIKMNCGVIY